jgi:pimeloyl-ACP methyl ester carboxylesterase
MRVLVMIQTLVSLSPPEQAEYLAHFRADSIVQGWSNHHPNHHPNHRPALLIKCTVCTDCELLRKKLLGRSGKWTLMGQSFGGFCAITYLSLAPHALEAVILTGGLAPVLCSNPDRVYTATFKRVLTQNALYFERYPHDQLICQAIAQRLLREPQRMPDGGMLTARRFQQLGFLLGLQGSIERIHYLVELAARDFLRARYSRRAYRVDQCNNSDSDSDGDGDDDNDADQRAYDAVGARKQQLDSTISVTEIEQKLVFDLEFLKGVDALLTFDTNPFYAILHESIYCTSSASRWSAHRIQNDLYTQFNQVLGECKPFLFTGEMVYPWMFDDYAALQPLKEAAEIIANKGT